MKICFISNYFNHHQKPFCDILYSRLFENFVFIATTSMQKERLELGYGISNVPAYVKNYFFNGVINTECDDDINNSDIVIIGSASPKLIERRISSKKIVFRYSERLAKSMVDYIKLPLWWIKWQKYYSFSNVYLLSASAFAYRDFCRIGFFKNRAYKWGYFPEKKMYDVQELIYRKKKNKILWCGRLIDWKHPDDVIRIANKLKENGYVFEINFIGKGVMYKKLEKLISYYKLDDCIRLLGSMSPESVRKYMEESGIYLFTSDYNEGWGAVLNESMNSGCAVVASHAAGAVPFLITNKENGLIYKSGDISDLYINVKFLLDNPREQKRLGLSAYNTIVDLWNANLASDRFIKFSEQILSNGDCNLFNDGPCSKDSILKNNWF